MTEDRTRVVLKEHMSISSGLHRGLLLTHSNRLPNDEERTILRDQLAEDTKDLENLCSRIEIESVKIEEKTRAMDELRSTLETAKSQYAETSRRIGIEHDVRRAIDRIEGEYTKSVTPSTSAARLRLINEQKGDIARLVIADSIRVFQEAQRQEEARVSNLEDSQKLEYMGLNLLLDRKAALEKQHEELLASIQKKRAFMGAMRRLPTEILVHFFLETVEIVIHGRICNPDSVPTHPTLAIVAVCRRWREIAFSTADLWRYLPIYAPPPLEAYPQLPLPMGFICRRAINSKELFVDWTRSQDDQSDRPMQRWAEVLKSLAIRLTKAKLDPKPTLSLFYSGESAMPLHVRFSVLENFIFHNIYPDVSRASAQHVRSIIMHFRERPRLKKIMAALHQLPDLLNFELYYQGNPHHHPLASRELPSLPKLQSLSLRLSMVPAFLGGDYAISTSIQSLKICVDVPSNVAFLIPTIWVAMVEFSGLATSLRRLEIDESTSLEHTTTYMAILLSELRSVATLSLRGGFMSPILDVLSQDHTLLPNLHRLEMHSTDIAESVIETFFNSRQSSGEPA